MVEGNFNHKPTGIIGHGLQLDSGILRRRAIHPSLFDARPRLVGPVGLPSSSTTAQNPQGQKGSECEGRATVSIGRSELGGDHGMEDGARILIFECRLALATGKLWHAQILRLPGPPLPCP